MGITGLLPLLKPIETRVNLEQYRGQRFGVDAYTWLHPATYSCTLELVQKQYSKAIPKVVASCMKKLNCLLHFGIIPIIVFDGADLPSKKKTDIERRKVRKENMEKTLQAIKNGDYKAAREYSIKAIDITPQLAGYFIKELKKKGIEYIVAPYEADAQLAYLNHTSYIDGVITLDSDLVVYGCNKIIYKLEMNGDGTVLNSADIGNIKEFKNWTHTKFRHMCILSGCDYLSNLPGIGLKKAQKALTQSHWTGYKVIKYWSMSGSLAGAPDVPIDYYEKFRIADLTFLYQRVYDPRTKKIVYLSDDASAIKDYDLSKEDFIGPPLSDEIGHGIAVGLLDPQTYKPLYEDEPDYTTVSSNNSITTKMKNKENSKNFSKTVNHPAKTSSHFKASSSSNVPSATSSSASGSKWKSFVGGFKGNGRTHIDHASVEGEKIVYPKSASITTAPVGETKTVKLKNFIAGMKHSSSSSSGRTPMFHESTSSCIKLSSLHKPPTITKKTPTSSPFFTTLNDLKRKSVGEHEIKVDDVKKKRMSLFDGLANRLKQQFIQPMFKKKPPPVIVLEDSGVIEISDDEKIGDKK